MSYIGNPPAEAYTNTVKDSFSGDGSTVAFTLSRPSLTNDVRVVVENVIQDPTVAYGVSGTTLTFTSAPPSGTNNIYVVHLGPAIQTTVPPDGVTVTDLNAYGDGAVAFTANRASSDGTIIGLRKDNSTVGSIGASSGSLYSGSGNVGLLYRSNFNAIYPSDSGGSFSKDASIDLGASGQRFKDLYLSGGVYLGGTGAANYLDDYEEGTFTPTLSSGFSSAPSGYTTQQGSYVKIGRYVYFQLALNADGATADASQIKFGGLPFTSTPFSGFANGGAFVNFQANFNTNATDVYHIANSTTEVMIILETGFGRNGNTAGININNEIFLSGFYFTNA